MTSERVEVITSVQRRRRWSTEEKERLVAAATAPGASASAVARAAGIHTSQLFRWRRQIMPSHPPGPAFAAVALSGPPPMASAGSSGIVEIEIAGARLRISGSVDPAVLSALIEAISGAARRR
jgi:transposase